MLCQLLKKVTAVQKSGRGEECDCRQETIREINKPMVIWDGVT